jgi:N-glycosylase/DNA lyase
VDVQGSEPSARLAGRILEGVRHVLRLDADLSGFYAKAAEDPDLRWVAAGAGRMLRSPTVFEDVVKTICTTNCSWTLTTKMVTAMVSELGEPPVGGGRPLENAFPSPAAMAGQTERFFRDIVRAGYRAPHFVKLSRAVAGGELDLEGLGRASREDLPDDDLERALLELPGVGPYAAAHIMMTIGRDSRLILDSWSRPKYAKLVGKRAVADAAIGRRFRRYGEHAGLAFWLFVTRDWVA